jgi:chromosome segregation ATPase
MSQLGADRQAGTRDHPSPTTAMPQHLTKSLDSFQQSLHELCTMEPFDSLLVSLLTLNSQSRSPEAREALDSAMASTKVARRVLGNNLHDMVSKLGRSITQISKSIDENEENVATTVRELSQWVLAVQVDVEKERSENRLVDYVKELEDLRAKLKELEGISKKASHRNEELWKTEEEMEKAIATERKRADKAVKNLDKVQKTFEELKSKYTKLFELYSQMVVDNVGLSSPREEFRLPMQWLMDCNLRSSKRHQRRTQMCGLISKKLKKGTKPCWMTTKK